MMYQTLLGYKLTQVLDNPGKLIPNSWAFCCPLPLTKHPEIRGGINKKIKFVLLYTRNSSLEKKIKIEQNIKETKIIN